jgi:hypothetical protein
MRKDHLPAAAARLACVLADVLYRKHDGIIFNRRGYRATMLKHAVAGHPKWCLGLP